MSMTTAQIAISVADHQAGATIPALARRAGCAERAMRQALKRHGGRPVAPSMRAPEDLAALYLLAFDVSSTSIGLVLLRETEVIHHETALLIPTQSLGQRVLAAGEIFQRLIPRLPQRPDLVAYEGPAHRTSPLSLYAQAACAGQLLATCAGLGIPVVSIAPTAAKKALTGSGAAKKPEMVLAAGAFLSEPYDEHTADALGVALAAAGGPVVAKRAKKRRAA